MKDSLLARNWRIAARLVSAAAVAFLANVSAHAEETPVKRAPAEVAVGGITQQERAAQAVLLRNELVAEMPAGATLSPIRIDITDQDRADLDVPYVSGTPLRIGVVKPITPTIGFTQGETAIRGVGLDVDVGRSVWAVAVTSPGAQAIRVKFTNFSLPPNAEVYFYSVDGIADGPYVGKGRNGTGEFWTRSISGDTGVIQLSYNGIGKVAGLRRISFQISELAHISGRFADGNEPSAEPRTHDTWPCSDNASCLVDANCVSGTPADPAEDAIAKMEWIQGPFVNTCSGGLLADTVSATQVPYFLTANHCTSSSISNLETWFNYTTSSCNGVCPHNILTGGAPPSDTVGFTVVASNSTSDFTLGTLNEAPPAGAVFLGWNNSPVAFTNGAQLWRISNANFGPQVYSQQEVDTGSPVCGGLPRGNIIYSSNNTGGTMGGSSGSPVVNSASEVVGQLYGCCGFNCGNDCDFNNNWTIDGAFAVTWPFVADFLDPPGGGCTGDPECDDGLFCNGAETCDTGSGNCQAGTPPNCNDGVSCTVDSCNESRDMCSNVANNGLCDNGQYCDGVETCHATLGCQAGTPPNCDDGVACTDDSCNESTDSCDNVANDANCNDGQFCNGAETCNATLGCQAGTPVNCDDGVACTDDSCNESTDSCDNVANDANCNNGLFCDGAETCHATLGCQAGSDPCPGQACDEGSDQCVGCQGNEECDDGLYCNGAEVCNAGTCEAGTPPNCDDGVGCTDDSCNEVTDSCDNAANDANCDNGQFCDGAETCHATLDCQAGTPVDCNDGNVCNGSEACVGDGCQAGTPLNCDDGDSCTSDSCDPVAGCQNDPISPCCGDGLCDGGEDQCNCSADCGAPPSTETNCSDGIDDDCDGATDCKDIDCIGDPNCAVGIVCGNGVCEGSGEDCFSCPADCRCAGGRNCRACCGDGVCGGPGENANNCPVDCGR